MEEYNLLTQKLLAEGYTVENHPDYVYIRNSYSETQDPLQNFDGGFRYYEWYIYDQTFRTPCGLLCKGSSCHSCMSYMGINWTFENDMAVTVCPYEKQGCGLTHEYLRGLKFRYHCNVHRTNEPYTYEGSLEAVLKLHDDKIRREKISFIMQQRGRVCEMQMHYDREGKKWKMNYDPGICASMNCSGICPVLGRKLDRKKGNVYYDIRTSGRRYELDGTLFEGERFCHIKKGCRFFRKPVSMDICRIFVNTCKDEILWKVKSQYSEEIFFADYFGRDWKLEVENIRAEQRESRDLMQDLQDARDGITVVHASDAQRKHRAEQKERREEAKRKRISKLEKRLLDSGYDGLESIDQIRAQKWLGAERTCELEKLRKKKIEERKMEPVQMSLFPEIQVEKRHALHGKDE